MKISAQKLRWWVCAFCFGGMLAAAWARNGMAAFAYFAATAGWFAAAVALYR